MRILYVGMKYDYGKPEQGLSFEHCNFYDSLHSMGHDILYFDFMSLARERGREWMNRRLLDVAKAERPELMFTFLFADELDKEAVGKISDSPDTTTLNWFADDHWRFEKFSSHWATCFNWVTTTATSALPKYEQLGYRNVIKTQWACNHFFYRRLDLPLEYDVTFVGKPHGDRRNVVRALREAGIDVNVWGYGWEQGRLSQNGMIETFNKSKVNLNLSNASTAGGGLGRRLRRSIRGLFARGRGATDTAQIKGRNFEVPGCGGFLLSGYADNVEDYYDVGREIACFESTRDLIDKVKYYLGREEERRAVALAGYERTLTEHTYAHRFASIFRRIGLPNHPAGAFLDGVPHPGETQEVR